MFVKRVGNGKFLLRPHGRKAWRWTFPNAARRALALGYDCRALRALAASRPTLNNSLVENSVGKDITVYP